MTAMTIFVSAAYAQSNPANVGPPPQINAYGCPQAATGAGIPAGGAGIVCAGPNNVGKFLSTGDGSIGATRLWTRQVLTANNTTPTVSSCGTTPSMGANATDMAGNVNMGSGSPVSCTVTFGVLYQTAPYVFISQSTGTSAAHQEAVTTTSFTVTFASAPGASGTIFKYLVVGASD